MSRVDLAIVGCGGMAGAHLSGLVELRRRELEVINLVAVCDVVEAQAGGFADRAERDLGRRPTVYSDLREMLERESRLDAVDVVTDHRSHHLAAVPCLEAGKHVIVEKPLGVTMRGARLIIETADRNGLVLATAENYRRNPTNRAIRWAIEQGRIGVPRILLWLNASYGLGSWGWRHDKMIAGGGWTLDGGVHYADLFLYNLGEVEEVYALTRTFEPVRYRKWPSREEPTRYTVEDTTMAVLKFKSGAVGQWTWTGVAPGERLDHCAIHGTQGSVSWQNGLKITSSGNIGQEAYTLPELQQLMMNALTAEEKERLFPNGVTNDVAIELWDFGEAILNHRRPEVDGRLGALAEAIPIAVFESSWSGQPVKVEKVLKCDVEDYQRDVNENAGLV